MPDPDLLPSPSVDAVREVLRLLTGHRWIPPGPSHSPKVEGKWLPASAENRGRRVLVTVNEGLGTFRVEVYEGA